VDGKHKTLSILLNGYEKEDETVLQLLMCHILIIPLDLVSNVLEMGLLIK
jgi:hypothetical protein